PTSLLAALTAATLAAFWARLAAIGSTPPRSISTHAAAAAARASANVRPASSVSFEGRPLKRYHDEHLSRACRSRNRNRDRQHRAAGAVLARHPAGPPSRRLVPVDVIRRAAGIGQGYPQKRSPILNRAMAAR